MGPRRLTKGMGSVAQKSSNRKIRRKEDDETEADPLDLMEGRQMVKPDDQLDLTEAQLKEEITRVLTANNPHAPQNIVRFSFKEGAFKQTNVVDQIAIHFALDGKMLHKDSDEARRQKVTAIDEEDEEEDVDQKSSSAENTEENSGEEDKDQKSLDESANLPEEGEKVSQKEEKKEEEEEEEHAEKPHTRKVALRNQFNFSERATQTFNQPLREKQTETEPPPRATFGATATQWEMFDSYEADLARQKALKEQMEGKKPSAFAKKDTKKKKLVTVDYAGSDDVRRVENAARIVERMVNQNSYDDIAQDFRYFEDASDEFRDQEGTLLPLWKFSYDKSKRMAVTALNWSPKYPDCFAVGQGSYDFLRQQGGMLILYSLKNPSFPERVYSASSGVMCLDILKDQTFLVCVGFYDGNVAVYNILDKRNEPTFTSTAKSGKHTDPVWQVKWQGNDLDDNLNFYSCSADGKVCMWALVKDELVMTEVISLKITDQPAAGPDGSQMQILGCGTSMAFHTKMDHLFLVGTEEGRIHKCSKAYSTQYLDTYQAHNMSVDSIKWNPFHQDVYVTCSADWTVKIWDNNYGSQSMFVFDLNSPVADVAWSPFSSTIFAAVTIDGKAHVFDISVNKYEALCEQTVVQKKKTKLTHVAFNNKHHILVIGDERGQISTFKLSPNLRKLQKKKKGEEHTPIDVEVEYNKLDKVLNIVRDPSCKKN